ncbi:hypothetical protein BABINDRAFT_161836 [Babjeviella inositovora NRRL Y-12698]|uniref:Anaphase-promoting complex subunit 3 n=1 Tax=Babjeviella inositovora NRRL Y-12698 TaxID=984486 RepID=A0A1E3QP02_9ASCO|nr:uncharacterized protein BABINDRAFT_161836 [Babjeviella inositovora NRRL Y-12698]ODQ79436.1 hypothetical protein BABINDRAFT_161836 [Babjeviella inositovora NRRL Y-12698]
MYSDCSISQLRSLVLYSLDHDLLANAEFTAERLLSLQPELLDSRHLYALVLFRRRKFLAAYNACAAHAHVGCAYVFAHCALELDMPAEGLFMLQQTRATWELADAARYEPGDGTYSGHETQRSVMPDRAAIYHLLGKLYAATGDIKQSAANHSLALKLNPYLFDSFEELCRMGINVRVKAVYHTDRGLSRDPFNHFKEVPVPVPAKGASSPRTSFFSKQATPETHVLLTPRLKPQTVPDAPNRRVRGEFSKPGKLSASKVTSRLIPAVPARARDTLKRGSTALGEGTPHSASERVQAETRLLALYATFAKALKAASHFDCFKAIRILSELPDNERNTPWVVSRLGRLHFEIVNYAAAERYFEQLRALDRARVEDMEYYSTLLWHLHKDIELSFLAHELYDVDPTAPQTWVAAGNLFSLRREPDEAIRCFQRAARARRFAYAATLQGHEYVANDAYENALESFRNALLVDPRHYNALYGLGMVYLKLGDYARAEFHFRKAVNINPVNVILLCCVGMVLEKTGRRELALKQYELAHKLQPLSALALFKKAQLLFTLQNYNSALIEFERVAELAPDEASVHFLLGQLYKLANRNNDAIKQFTVALTLDPKGSHLIKEAIMSLES